MLAIKILKIICGHAVHIIVFSKTLHQVILFRFQLKGITYFTKISDFPQKFRFCKLIFTVKKALTLDQALICLY